jgi:hypothetical protein
VAFRIIPSTGVDVQNIVVHKNGVPVTATTSLNALNIFSRFVGVDTISAGTTNNYTLKADVSCLSGCSGPTGSGSLTVNMIGDLVFPYSLPSYADDNNVNFEWTDFWRTPTQGASAPNVRTSTQWSSGYLVPTASGGKMPATSTPSIFVK